MAKGIKINKGTATALILLVGIATIGFLLACADAPRRDSQQLPTGMSGLTSWNGWHIWYDSGQGINLAGGMDIDGEVGHPLSVGSCRANCEPGGNWTANHRIISGSFPPGVDFNSGNAGIYGIPTQRGHWIVQVELYDVMCNGVNYAGIRQELRFHIGGSGVVH